MKRVKRIISYEPNGFLGKGITVAVLDTGVSNHFELKGKIYYFQDCIHHISTPYDDNGHGSHVCGILAGAQLGMAPECRLMVWKILDERGNGRCNYILEAIRWIVENRKKYNIRILNISAGMEPDMAREDIRRLIGAVELLWDMGVVVVTAAGNQGPRAGSITAPGISKKVITVGSSDDGNKNYSGRGPTHECVCKPDVIAPGNRVYSCNVGKYISKAPYVPKSGTSMSAPIVAGAIACLLSKYNDMGNLEVKMRLRETSTDMGLDHNRQGWGLLNVKNLLK